MSVADFFIDKNVFITGGSGFLGKLIIEKLLRSCPGIGKIYVLLRPRKGKAIEERLEKIIESPIFNPLRHQNPDALRKLIPIKGDVSELNLGISKEDRELLVNTVNIIYHSAASVRFDDFLKDAIILNVRGTREVAKLALDLKSISIFVHISTTYCNCDKLVVEEKLYPAHTSWRDAIMLAEECDQQTLETLTQKYISPLPNTYTFAKSLGEHVVNDLCQGKIPTIITRPSVVMNTESDPIQGYTDNFNGPVGLVTAAGKGLVRVGFGKPDTITDYIPADYVIKGMVLATASQGITKSSDTVEVYNLSYNHISCMSLKGMTDIGKKLFVELPYSQMLRYPIMTVTENFYRYYIETLILHMFPALLIDSLLTIFGQKRRLVKLVRKIYIAYTVLAPFVCNTYWFLNDKYINMQKDLKEEDSAFSFNYKSWTDEEMYEFIKGGKLGMEVYLFGEKLGVTGSKAKQKMMKYWLAEVIFKTILLTVFLWIFMYKLNFFNLATIKTISYFNSLSS
ncbi:fatty acyl-CoA reductase wat-like isoform X1 [Diabrotica virgifera virgifera]|uniref:Fatty acyl-CoA reductase n=1 Tax=Diabrotica virgifera virgifera TaxID=50390 RepID=A0ABM5K2V9_DIAVI|nr:fatty acyl-CoA reductase wat-like isoform X1 [Diabrotica virgifera virgifera]XP_050504526.1 fatty acyl-CoA reductase wat-like isoform X1 [Diabrotica virgifera virgifera]